MDTPNEPAKIPEPSPAQIRAVRSYFKWTQKQAGVELGINDQTLMRIEKHGTPHKPTLNTIVLNIQRLGLKFDGDGNLILPPEPPASA